MKISTLEKNGIKPDVIETIALFIERIPWPSRRQAMAEVTTILLDGKPRVAADAFGWNRVTVSLGMDELRTGIICHHDLSQRRKPKTEEKYPKLLEDIQELMASECHADPHLRTMFAYTDKTATSVCGALVAKGWPPEIIPSVRTMSDVLMRLGYRLRSVAKTKVQKTEWADQIFENIRTINANADSDSDAIRISLDTKAIIHVGDYSLLIGLAAHPQSRRSTTK